MGSGAASLEKGSVLKTLNAELPDDPVSPLLPKNMENICPHKTLYMNVRSIIHKSQKVETQMTMNRYMWYTKKMKYYSAIKRNKALIHATTWINRENIVRLQTPDTNGHILHDSAHTKCPE